MKYVWPRKSLSELFQDAEKTGETSVELKSPYEAELLRFALYNFRRRSKIGERYLSYQIGVEENKLTIFRSIEIETKRTGT